MGFLLHSKAEGNVGPRSSRQLLPAACSPELPGFADHIQTASGSRLEPASLGSLSAGARSLGKGCRPSHGPTRRPVPMHRCPASVHDVGMCPAPLLPSPKLGQKPEVSTAFYVQRVVPFFLEASFLPAPFTSREKHPQNTTKLLPRSQGTARGCLEMFGEKQKEKAHTLLFGLSIPQPTHTNGQHHRLHFIRQRTQESTLTREQAGPCRRPRSSGSPHCAQPVGRDSGLI